MVYTFYTEDGQFDLSYDEYLKNPKLMQDVKSPRRKRLFLGRRIVTYSEDFYNQNSSAKKAYDELKRLSELNPLRFFMPHCASSDRVEDSTPAQFINDRENILTGLIAGNRYSKTTSSFIKLLTTLGAIECDPSWEIFTEHGINYVPFSGPKTILVASFAWSNIRQTIWPEIMLKWLPRDEIAGMEGYELPQNSVPGFSIKMQKSGTTFWFAGMNQPQSSVESAPYDDIFWDEFPVEAKFDGGEARMKTRRVFEKDDDNNDLIVTGAHVVGVTPIKLPGMPETGGNSFLREMEEGSNRKGLTVKMYHGNIIDDVPDWYLSEVEKERLLEAVDEARRTNNKHQYRHLMARLYGDYETHGDLVYPQWDRDVHVVTPFEIPDDWTAYRFMDHGRVNPTACLWCAINPDNDWFIYREFENPNSIISESVEEIVRMSGNELEKRGLRHYGDIYIEEYREKQVSERYAWSTLDGASFLKPDDRTTQTIGEIYNTAGLADLTASPKGSFEDTIPLVQELLRVRPDRKHYVTGEYGAPRIYVFNTCIGFIRHIESYMNKPESRTDGTMSEKPRGGKDHDLDALRYGVLAGASYNRSRPIRPLMLIAKRSRSEWIELEKRDETHSRGQRVDPITGY